METHTHDAIINNLCIPGFKLLSHKNRPVNRKSNTSSGGMAFFIRESLASLVSEYRDKNDDSIWIKIKKEKSGEHEDTFIGLVLY